MTKQNTKENKPGSPILKARKTIKEEPKIKEENKKWKNSEQDRETER